MIKSIFLIMLMLPTSTLACNYSTDIKENQDGTYTYSRSCHIDAGKKIRGYFLQEQEIKELRLSLDHSNLALSKAEERAKLWMDTSISVQKDLARYERLKDWDGWIKFGGGVLFTGLAIYGASKIVK